MGVPNTKIKERWSEANEAWGIREMGKESGYDSNRSFFSPIL
jgi:hypothetical protein